jgi:hypothetical protein
LRLVSFDLLFFMFWFSASNFEMLCDYVREIVLYQCDCL